MIAPAKTGKDNNNKKAVIKHMKTIIDSLLENTNHFQKDSDNYKSLSKTIESIFKNLGLIEGNQFIEKEVIQYGFLIHIFQKVDNNKL